MTTTMHSMQERLTIRDLKLPNNDINNLKRFFSISKEDEKSMAKMKEFSDKSSATMIEKFYKHILSEPETQKFFGDPRVLERAKRAQVSLFDQMTAGKYDVDYLENRLFVGSTHNRINLPPKWYIGSFSYYLDCLATEMVSFYSDKGEALDRYRTFVKMVLLDMAMVMEAFVLEREKELKANAEALEEQRRNIQKAEELNRSVLNAANHIGIYAVSKEGTIQTWNKGAEFVTGYTAAEAIGRDLRIFYPDVSVVDYEMREATNKGNVQAEGWRIAKGDRRFYAKASLSPLKTDQGELTGFVKIVQDETERMKNQEKAEQTRKDIDQTARVLQGVTVQISAVSTQLSSSTAETTAALSETTATAEEAKQTADQTSTKAKAVSDESKAVAAVSRQGLEATDATINGMLRIREQMESIAECMVQLSNQSKLIGDIIASVDDLAQQSNLLAVNASIEAAKAGEQGKGFAVVAQEVKNLSQQSKAATAHVRSILNDIVKATTAATMATEQGGKAVEVGHQQATEAGRVIKTLSDSIEKATQATELIEVSSQQQLVGMKQIVDALDSIRVASQQNLESANQLEGAGKELSELGKQLVQLTNS